MTIILCAYLVLCYLGSSGGKGEPRSFGGTGGGILYLNVSNRVTVNGELRVNGGSARGSYSGGGSGGSIYLRAKTLHGSGKIQVRF